MRRILFLFTTILGCLFLTVLSYGCNCECGNNPSLAVYTYKAIDVTSNSATVRGQVRNIPSGYDAHAYFLWALDEDALVKFNHNSTGEFTRTDFIHLRNDRTITADLTGLIPDTVYYFQAVAGTFRESTGTPRDDKWPYGIIESFTTLSEEVGEEEEEEEEEYYTLTISSSENGRVVNPSEGSYTYNEDEIVNLVAEADEGYQFDRWEGDVADPNSAITTATMNADKTVTAYFIPIPPFELTSSAFNDGEPIPSIHSKEGGNISPPLEWTGVPSGTQSFVLIIVDPYGWDGEPCDHWIVFNIPADVTSLAQGASSTLPEGALHGMAGGSRITYYGCYPPEGRTNSYYFTIYALDTTLGLNQGATKQQVMAAMAGHILDEAQLVGTYRR